MVDLCVGPHIPHTGKIKAFMVTKNSASYFLGDANNDSLQRIYGISFPDKKQLADYKVFLAEAAKRDHRKIGKDQELFFFNDLSPGSCFFLPHGTRIYNSLVELMRVSLQKLVFHSETHIFCGRVNTSSVDTKKVSLLFDFSDTVISIRRSHFPQHVQQQTLGDIGSLAELQGRYVLARR